MYTHYFSTTAFVHGRNRMLVGFITTYAISAYLMFRVWILIRWGILDKTLCDKFVSHLQQVGDSLRLLRFPPPRYSWNIVESGIKHHNTNPICIFYFDLHNFLIAKKKRCTLYMTEYNTLLSLIDEPCF